MANDITLKLDVRTVSGKKVTKLRNSGYVPSVVYGGKSEPVNTQSNLVETTKVAQQAGKNSPVNIVVDSKKKFAIIKDIDVDPVKHVIRHVAFHTIKQNEVITTEVPVHLVGMGESNAEKAGLVVLQAIEHVTIKAKPADLPEALEVSIAELTTPEDKLTLGDVNLPEGVEYADQDQDLGLVVANVYEPSALQAQNEAAAGEAEGPETVQAKNGADVQQVAEDGQASSKDSEKE